MGTGDAVAAAEGELVAHLAEASRARAELRAIDDAATAAAAAQWQGVRKHALPLFLARDVARKAPRGRTRSLAALPVAEASQELRWRRERQIGGIARLALDADPPSRYAWRVDLTSPAAACGFVALRPDGWEHFHDRLELIVRLRNEDGTAHVEHRVRIHPHERLIDRRWVPWRVELPAVGEALLELETTVPDGRPERAWMFIGDPVIDLGGRPLRRPRRRTRSRSLGAAPVIALLTPVHDPPLDLLERTLASVKQQTSGAWELCLTDDGSTDPGVRRALEAAAASDPRIRLHRNETAQGISAATNAALELATAPYVAPLDHDDLLAPHAIERVGRALTAEPAIDLLYTDNDLVTANDVRFAAALKPAWSPDLMRACMYTLHLGVYRRSLVQEIGGWRSDYDGAQDHDLVLRLTERTDRVRHLAGVLAHWRAHAGSAALGELAKPTAYDRGRDAVAAQLERLGLAGTVERLDFAGRYRVRWERQAPVVVLLPADAPEELLEAWRAALRAGDEVRRCPVAAPDADLLGQWRATAAGAPLLIVVEDFAVPADAAAVDELLGHVEAGGAAAAGGVVVDAERRVLAGGVAFPDGVPLGLHVGASIDQGDRHPSLTMVSNRQGVRGVVALRRAGLDGAGTAVAGRGALLGLTSALAEAGGRVVWSPHAVFTATAEAADRWRTTRPAELAALDRGTSPDPFWNPLRRWDVADETYPQALDEADR